MGSSRPGDGCCSKGDARDAAPPPRASRLATRRTGGDALRCASDVATTRDCCSTRDASMKDSTNALRGARAFVKTRCVATLRNSDSDLGKRFPIAWRGARWVTVCRSAACTCRFPVAQRKSTGIRSRRSQVRFLSGKPLDSSVGKSIELTTRESRVRIPLRNSPATTAVHGNTGARQRVPPGSIPVRSIAGTGSMRHGARRASGRSTRRRCRARAASCPRRRHRDGATARRIARARGAGLRSRARAWGGPGPFLATPGGASRPGHDAHASAKGRDAR